MKRIKSILICMILMLLVVPVVVFAYSDKVILGGRNIGIKVNNKYIMIVGFYKVNGKLIASDIGLKVGDYIIGIDNEKVNTIDELMYKVSSKDDDNLLITVLRDGKELSFKLKLYEENGIYKTGIYVKDTINGIGSLTYIDPNTKVYGALGHDISSKYSNKMIDTKDGIIFKSDVIDINKATNDKPGSKEAKLYANELLGNISKNTISGIYGKYNDKIDNNDLIAISKPDEVEIGPAKIRTVIDDDNEELFDIDIISIDKESETKNILFNVTDKRLLEKTGGIIAGMSGSPIIQNNKLVGAVTHVVVGNADKGFGIFITTMLEEGDKE